MNWGTTAMHEFNEEYMAKLRKGIVRAICEASVPGEDAASADQSRTLYIGTAEVCRTLTILLAEFLEGVPGLDTSADIRRISETVARTIRLEISEVRRVREETGGEPLPSVIVRPS